MRNMISNKTLNTPRSMVREFVGMSYKYDNVLSFGFGQPDFTTAPHITKAIKDSIDRGESFYAPAAGILPLREAICELYEQRGVHYDTDEIVVGIGGISSIFLALSTMLDIGDEVIVHDPCYATYVSTILELGAVPVPVPIYEEDGFMIRPEALRAAITPKTKVLFINFPSNPTGGVATRENLEEIAKICVENDIFVLTDEMYRTFLWTEEPFTSIVEFPGMKERTVIVDGFSKTYAMTGYRLGWLAAPKHIIPSMHLLLENIWSSVPEPIQWGGIAALKGGDERVREMMELYRHRKVLLNEGINSLGIIHAKPPAGAFYLFVNIKDTGLDSRTFSTLLLDREQVLTIPGLGFGKCGEGFVRFCYATNDDNINEGVDRVARFLKTI